MKIFMVLLLFCVSGGFTTNPGFKARITRNGLSYANKVAISALGSRVLRVKIPTISGRVGHVSYRLSNLWIKSFTPSASSMELVPGTGIRWTASGAWMSMSGRYRYKFRKASVRISGHGSVEGSISGLSFNIHIKLDDERGKPHIAGNECSCDIDSAKMHFHGGAAWIYKLFSRIVEVKTKALLRTKMCESLLSAVNDDANDKLARLPISVVVDKKFRVDYSLMNNPVFDTKFVETDHKGEVFWEDDTDECPYTPAPLPDTEDETRMLYLWLSDYMATSMAYVGYKHGFFNYKLTASDLPRDDRDFFNTTCSHMCIGKLIPKISKKYPDCHIMMDMRVTEVPQTHVHKGFIGINLTGEVDLYAHIYKRRKAFLLTISVKGFQATVEATIDDERLKGKIKSTHFDVTLKKSRIGPVSSAILHHVMNVTINSFLVPQLNAEWQMGLELPLTDDIHFDNAQLSTLKGALVISTDLLYVPKVSLLPEPVQDVMFDGEVSSRKYDPHMNFQVVGDKMRDFPQI